MYEKISVYTCIYTSFRMKISCNNLFYHFLGSVYDFDTGDILQTQTFRVYIDETGKLNLFFYYHMGKKI